MPPQNSWEHYWAQRWSKNVTSKVILGIRGSNNRLSVRVYALVVTEQVAIDMSMAKVCCR